MPETNQIINHFWRYHFQLLNVVTALDENGNTKISSVVAGPCGFGTLVTETPNFPADKLAESLKTNSFPVVQFQQFMVAPAEYDRIVTNDTFDVLGCTTYLNARTRAEEANQTQPDEPVELKLYDPDDEYNEGILNQIERVN